MSYPALIVAAAQKLSERLYELPAIRTPRALKKAELAPQYPLHPEISKVVVALITREPEPSMLALETYGRMHFLMEDKMPNEREIRALYKKRHAEYQGDEKRRFHDVFMESPSALIGKLMNPLEDPEQSAVTMALWYTLLKACGHKTMFNADSPTRDAVAEMILNSRLDFNWVEGERASARYTKARRKKLSQIPLRDMPESSVKIGHQIPEMVTNKNAKALTNLIPDWVLSPQAMPIPFSWALLKDWTVRFSQEVPQQPDEFLKLWDNDGMFPPPEIMRMIGLNEPKQEFMQLFADLLRDKAIATTDIEVVDTEAPGNNLMFVGPPGTAKTTFARMTGRLFHRLGMLSKGHLIEAKRKDLVGRYIGHTAPKTEAVLKKALGGVFFLDEAYQLMGSTNDFGSEALETIMGYMEDQRDNLVTIMAGYPDDMNLMLDMNDGLESRFRQIIRFPAYTENELHAIFEQKAKNAGLIIKRDTREIAYKTISHAKRSENPKTFGNGRYIRDFTKAVGKAIAYRLLTEKVLPGDLPLGSKEMQTFMETRFEGSARAVLVTPTPDDIRNARIFDRKAIENRGKMGFAPG